MVKRKIIQKRERGFSLREQYSLSWKFIKESSNFTFAIILIFLLFLIVGFFIPLPESMVNQLLQFIKDLISQTEGLSTFGLIKFIFVNNLFSSLQGMILGIFLGIVPVISALSNGFILGFVARLSVSTTGIASLWRIFPHGIFELPAVFISLGMGMKLGTFIFKKEKLNSLGEYFFNSLRVFVFVIVPLLIVAAIIESFLIVLSV